MVVCGAVPREPEGIALSTQLLQAVLDGQTYAAAGRAHGLTRTAVERRVKSCVLGLLREGGIDGLDAHRARFLHQLRAHRAGIAAALARRGPAPARPVRGSVPCLSDADIRAVASRVRRHTRTPERDLALWWVLLATGLRPLEVARLQVADYLDPDGTVRAVSRVRAEVAVNRRERPLFFASASACAAIDAYLATRGALAPGGVPGPGYRGLAPCSPLFFAAPARPFRTETVASATDTPLRCPEIHEACRTIFRRTAVPGLSARTLRHTVVVRLQQRGADAAQIGELLGVRAFHRFRRPRTSLAQLMHALV